MPLEMEGQGIRRLRIWVMQNPAEPGSEVATKKGIRLSVDLLPKLTEALNETSRILKEKETGDRSPEKEKQNPHKKDE